MLPSQQAFGQALVTAGSQTPERLQCLTWWVQSFAIVHAKMSGHDIGCNSVITQGGIVNGLDGNQGHVVHVNPQAQRTVHPHGAAYKYGACCCAGWVCFQLWRWARSKTQKTASAMCWAHQERCRAYCTFSIKLLLLAS